MKRISVMFGYSLEGTTGRLPELAMRTTILFSASARRSARIRPAAPRERSLTKTWPTSPARTARQACAERSGSRLVTALRYGVET